MPDDIVVNVGLFIENYRILFLRYDGKVHLR